MTYRRTDIIAKFRARIAEGKRNKLSKLELEDLVETLIEQLQQAKSAEEIHQICRAEIALLEEGYKKLTLASIYIPRYRAAIKEAIATHKLTLSPDTSHEYEYQQRVTGQHEKRSEHWALTYFKYTPEEYEKLDTRQAQVNQSRLLSLKAVPLEQYLVAINELLYSQEKFAARHQAIAIAALTGRRMGEVVSRGEFSLTDHPYQLHFTGQQKYERDGYDIITLIPAAQLLDKIIEFRAQPEIKSFTEWEEKTLKEQLNKFDVQINKECNKYLQETQIVPPLEGKKNVTIHNLRSLWGAIATHYFCPEEQHEYAFLQHYLGHILKSSATGHYFRYQLTDVNGKLIKTKGIKLNEVPVLPLLDGEDIRTMDDQNSLFETIVTEPQTSYGISNISQQLTDLQAQWKKCGEEIEARLDTLKQSINLTITFIEREKLKKLQRENLELKKQNTELSKHLQNAQSKLEQFRILLLGETESPTKVTKIESISALKKIKATESSPIIRKGRKPGKAIERAKRIFLQIQYWNQANPDSTFATNPGLLESIFRIHRKAAKQFCEEFKTEIWEHHQDIGVENESSHNRGKDVEALLEFMEQS